MSDLKIQGEVQISAEGAESALDRVAAKAEQMSGRVSAGADKAGRAVDGIGSGADKSAQQFSRAEGRISDSIKRATQSIEQLGKTASQKLEIQIAEKGLDPAKFEPALAKLRELEKAQGNVGISAGQMQNALRGVPAQFTDIATSLASGQKPLTVFLQQGGQLKDMFGGAGPAARALGGYVLGLVNPFTVAAAAAGTLALAYHQGSKEADAYRAALILTGNAAGTTADRLADMAGRVSTATGKTKGVASEALAALAGSGSIASASMQSVAEAAVRMASVTGESVGDIVKKFDDLGRTPAASSAKLTEQYRYLTAEIYTQIKALEDQGRTAEAAAIAQRTFADAMTDRAKHVEAGLGSLERAWKGVTGAAKSAWDSMLDIGRPDTIQEKLDKAQAALLRTRHSGKDQSALKQEIEHLQEMQRIQSRSLAVQDQQNQKREAALQFEKDGEKFLTKQQQLETEILRIRNTGLAAGAKEEEIQRRIAIAREKYAEKPKAGSANDAQQIFAAQLAAEKDHSKALVDIIQERTKQRILSEREGVEQILAVQNDGFVRQAEILKAQLSATKDTGDREKIKQQIQALGNAAMLAAEQAATARAKIEAEALKSHQEYMKGIGDETAALIEKARAAEEENLKLGMTAEQLAALTAQRYDEIIARKEAQAIADREVAGREAEVALIEEQISALRRLKNAEVARPALQKQREEWQRTADTIERSLTDALLRGFESGKSFAENFRDTLKNMFQTLVLRPVISAVMAPVAGGIASMMPGTAAAGQGGVGAAGIINTGSSLYNLSTGAGSGLYNSFALSGAGEALGLSTSSLIAPTATELAIDAGILGGAAAPALEGAAGLTSLGSTIGTALPWVGGALAIASLFGGGGLFGKKAKTPKINLINADIDGWSQFDTAFGTISGAAKHDKNFAQTFEGLKPIAQMDASLAALLSQSEIDAVKAALAGTGTGEVKSKGNVAEDFVRNRLDIITDAVGGWINDLADTAEGELQDVYAQTAQILATRKMQGAETLANELLAEGGSAFFRESGTAAAAFARMATALGTVNPVLEQINVGVLAMSASAGNAATDLLKAFGSVDAFRNSTGAYYANFFSEAERAEAQQRQLKGQVFSAFAEFGAQVPKTRSEFRALVESMDVTTEAGQKAFAALMNVSSAFAAITVNADAAVAAERRAVTEARRAREAAAQASVDTVAEAVKGLRESVASDAAIAGGIIGGIRVSADEYEQFAAFADALATARTELGKVPAEMTGAIAAIEKQIVETVRLLGEQVAPLRLRQGDAQGALAALMAGVRIPSDRYTDASGNFVAAGLNRAMLFEQAKAAQQLGNRASADALNIQNVGGVLASLAGITQSQDFQFALREQMAGSLGVPIQGALMDVLSGAFDFAAGAAASGYVSNGIGLARVRAAGSQLSAAQTGADIDAYKAAIRNLNGAMKAGSIDAEQYQTGLDAIGEIFKATIPLVDNIEAQAERVRNASLEWGRAGLESITYYFGQIGEQVAQMAEAAAAAAEPIALATSAIGRMNSVSAVFGESANAAYYGLAGGGADGRTMLNGSLGAIGNAALVSTAAAIAAEIMTTADAARVAEQLSEQFAGIQRRDASLLLDGLSAYDSAAFERSFARLNNALNKGDISTDQYRELFDLSIKTYQGTENAANDLQDAFAELRRAARSLADELLIDKGLTPLSTPQRFAEIRRQYEETIDKARTGDLEAIGDMEGITRTMLEAARNNAGSAEEYNLFSAGTIRTLRDLEAEQPLVLNPTPLLSGRSNATEDMLKELQALRAEIAAMRADNSAENVAIAKATNKTASVLDAVTTGNLTFVTEAA